MPGKNPAEAIKEYIEPLQQSLSCFTKQILRPSGYGPDQLHIVTISETTVKVRTQRNEILHFAISQGYSIVKRLLIGYKIQTRSYAYTLENEEHREILAYHWHPEETPAIPFPHLHICSGAGDRVRQEILDIHFKTNRFAFEEFCQLMIKEFKIIPHRSDTDKVLAENLKKFQAHKSW